MFDATLIFEEINKELEEYLLEKSIKTDLTASVFDFLEGLSDRVQEEFDQLLKGDTDKKWFVKALTCIFSLLLNKKLVTTDKIKGIFKIAIETTLKIWQGQN